jgi:DNA-binding MarR family transcriptional regulator
MMSAQPTTDDWSVEADTKHVPPGTTVEARLLAGLWRLAQVSTLHCEAVIQDTIEYSVAHLRVLRALDRWNRATTPSDLAKSLGCTRANVSQLLAHLELQGYVQRRREPDDLRRSPLVLTLRGRDAYATGERQLDAEASRVFEALDDGERRTLLALLEKLGP